MASTTAQQFRCFLHLCLRIMIHITLFLPPLYPLHDLVFDKKTGKIFLPERHLQRKSALRPIFSCSILGWVLDALMLTGILIKLTAFAEYRSCILCKFIADYWVKVFSEIETTEEINIVFPSSFTKFKRKILKPESTKVRLTFDARAITSSFGCEPKDLIAWMLLSRSLLATIN